VWQWVFIVRSSALNPSKGTLVNQVNNPSKGSGWANNKFFRALQRSAGAGCHWIQHWPARVGISC